MVNYQDTIKLTLRIQSRLNKNDSPTKEETNNALLIKEIKSLIKEEFRNQLANLEGKIVKNNWESFGD